MMKLKGIHGEEILACGCKIKLYKGGKRIQTGCSEHPESITFVCIVCGLVTSKRQLAKHKWTHAY